MSTPSDPFEEATRVLRRIRLANKPVPEISPAELASRMILVGKIREKLDQMPEDVLAALAEALELIADEPDRYDLEWMDGVPKAAEKRP